MDAVLLRNELHYACSLQIKSIGLMPQCQKLEGSRFEQVAACLVVKVFLWLVINGISVYFRRI